MKIISWILEKYWAWKLLRIKRKTNCIAIHPYPADIETGWKKHRKEFFGIKQSFKIIEIDGNKNEE